MAILRVVSPKHGTFDVLIDDEDIPLGAANVPWGVLLEEKGRVYFKNSDGLLLHRLIKPCPDGLETDHTNHDYLDLRKSELRCATKRQNQANARKRNGTSSRFKGVYRNSSGRWSAQITHNYRIIYLGSCPDTPEGEIECAKRYDARARELFGEFALTNFPEPEKAA